LRFKLVQKVLKICSSFMITILKKNKSEKADQWNTFPFHSIAIYEMKPCSHKSMLNETRTPTTHTHTHTPQTNEIFGLRKFMHSKIMNLCVGYNQMGIYHLSKKISPCVGHSTSPYKIFPLVIKTSLIYIK